MGWETYIGPTFELMKSLASQPLLIIPALAIFYTWLFKPETIELGFLTFKMKATFPKRQPARKPKRPKQRDDTG